MPNAAGKKKGKGKGGPEYAPLTFANVQQRGPVKEGLTTNWGVPAFNVGENGLKGLPADYVHTPQDDVIPDDIQVRLLSVWWSSAWLSPSTFLGDPPWAHLDFAHLLLLHP